MPQQDCSYLDSATTDSLFERARLWWRCSRLLLTTHAPEGSLWCKQTIPSYEQEEILLAADSRQLIPKLLRVFYNTTFHHLLVDTCIPQTIHLDILALLKSHHLHFIAHSPTNILPLLFFFPSNPPNAHSSGVIISSNPDLWRIGIVAFICSSNSVICLSSSSERDCFS